MSRFDLSRKAVATSLCRAGEKQAPSVGVGLQNKYLVGGEDVALGFYSHTRFLENEAAEDAGMCIDRRCRSNLYDMNLTLSGCSQALAGVSMAPMIGVPGTSSEAFYQAMKFEQLADADFVASRSSTKEQAFAGRRGHLPLLEEEVQYFVERELPLTWVSLEDREGDDEPTLRQRSALRNMVNKTRPNAVRDSAGQVLVRIAPVRQGYFGTPGFRCMYAILLEKFLAPETDEVCHATLCNLAANPHVKGLVEVRQPDGPFDKIWTENHGDGHNMLGKMLYHLVEGLRIPSTPEALRHLDFSNLAPKLESSIGRQDFVH